MRKLLIFIGLLLSLSVSGQMLVGVVSSQGGSAVKLVVTDNFDSYDNASDLGSQTNWGTELGSMTVASSSGNGKVYPSEEDSPYLSSCYYNDTFNSDQYSKIGSMQGELSTYNGVSVRNKGDGSGNCYAYIASTSVRSLYKFVDGEGTVLATITEASETGTLELRVVGNELQMYFNGSLDTGLSNTGDSGKLTDNTFSVGKPGVAGRLYNSGRLIDLWEGGEL